MNIHEYQAKSILRSYKVPVPDSVMITSEKEIEAAVEKLAVDRWVVKAQVHAGGRGKAGGVRIAKDRAELTEAVRALLGGQLVTFQTDAKGLPINQVLIEAPSNIQQELYLGAVVDRVSQRIVFMASLEGGMEIEEVAKVSPEKIAKVTIDPLVGLLPYQSRELFFKLGLAPELMRQFSNIMMGLYTLFLEKDLSLLEINPLILSKENQLVCLDAKLNIDENALYRQSEVAEMRDADQEDPRENHAQKWDLNYIALEGNIGCMVNGAGLAMATMDLIKLEGGDPANFLDVGGSATQERVAEAFKIITSDTKVQGILVNIFGGIVRCDLIAEGIIAAVEEIGLTVPVVVRLEGNNAEIGAKKLAESGLNIIAAQGFADAAKRVVQAVQ